MTRELLPFEFAMLRHIASHPTGQVDLADAASSYGWWVAEGQPRVSQKWNEAGTIFAFNMLCLLDGLGLVEMVHPKRAPKYVPAKGYWDGIWRLTPEGERIGRLSYPPDFVEKLEALTVVNMLRDEMDGEIPKPEIVAEIETQTARHVWFARRDNNPERGMWTVIRRDELETIAKGLGRFP